MTWQDGLTFFGIIVVGSFVAGAIDAWLEQRKWEKNRRDGIPGESLKWRGKR